MSTQACSKIWHLAPGELVHLPKARGTRLHVTRGKLWVTLEHDQRDIVLESGASFTIDRGGLTLAEAQESTNLHLDRRATRRSVLGRLGKWLRDAIVSRVKEPQRAIPYY